MSAKAPDLSINMIPVLEPSLNGNELQYVTECIESNWVSSQGKFVTRFENIFEKKILGYHALAVSNGTVALHLALVALGIGPGDEVIVPDLTFAASINAILHCGASPVLVDVDINTCVLDPIQVRNAIGSKTRAIMVVHLYGFPCDMDVFCKMAKELDLLIIEDAAEALGSEYKGQPVGGFGDAATFSFFGNKTITTGEGGMVLFRNEKVAEKARVLRDHGMSKEQRYWHEVVGFNYRMTNLQAAVGVAQIERLDSFIEKKCNIAKKYNKVLSEIEGIQTPVDLTWGINSFWLYWIKIDPLSLSPKVMAQELREAGVETRAFFYPLHIQPPYLSLKKHGELKNSSMLAETGLCLPSAVTLTNDNQEWVITCIKKIVGRHGL